MARADRGSLPQDGLIVTGKHAVLYENGGSGGGSCEKKIGIPRRAEILDYVLAVLDYVLDNVLAMFLPYFRRTLPPNRELFLFYYLDLTEGMDCN